jgi:hypothetical protein
MLLLLINIFGSLLIVNAMIFGIYSRSVRKELVYHFEWHRGTLLKENQFQELKFRYSYLPLFPFFEPFPPVSSYTRLYTDPSFVDFVNKSKKRMKWMLYSMGAILLLTVLFGCLNYYFK